MSDNELFAVLLGALAVALWLRRSMRKRSSGKKIGVAAANAAIAGVASAVVGGIIIKFFRGSVTEMPAVVLVMGGLVTMGIGLSVSVISALRGLGLALTPMLRFVKRLLACCRIIVMLMMRLSLTTSE